MKTLEFTTEELCLEPRLRIALVTETYPPEINGVAMTLQRMVDGLIGRGHRVQLIRPRQARSDVAQSSGDYEEMLSRGWKLPRYDGLRFGLPAKAALVRAWSRQRPDLVHVATEGPLGWTAISAARKLRLPVTSDFHTNFDHYSEHYGVGWLRQPVSAYLRRFHNRTETTFVPTAEMARALRAQGYAHVEVVSRGVDTALFSPARRNAGLRAQWGLERDDVALISVGRLAPEKNLQLVLRAYAAVREACPRTRLVIVGDGPMREAVARDCPEALLCGMRTGEDLAAHYASADLFLFPSLTETFGNVVLEAMASGVCTVAYDYAAAAEVVRDMDNGLCAPSRDEPAFIERAVRAATDGVLRQRLAAQGRASAEALDWARVIDHFAGSLIRVWRTAAAVPAEAVAAEHLRMER
ncbi:glycosyltransferase family 4 protein [Thauera sinica]|uniref:Glycosyltransferase family 4 protein n=1 Tax=Thauera sinica TaxID=2665146 RepID=A0ABW1AKY9_9RHOO|nr:glycosyltransferase family 1 protein [Thauera sp. K11]ATE59861.1 glycoside hydrolase [Thauera sp. K11]